MYEQTFQFSSRPFNSVPRLEDFFAGLSYQQAMDVAHMCVDRSTGPVVVVGNVGMGKSLMLKKIGQSFDSRFDVVHIECSRLEARSELLQSILFELNLPYSGLTEGELRLSLMAYLKESRGADDGVLLLVDEADRLSIELIDELRLVTNQIRDGRSLVQLVLAGTQRLEESLADPKLASFNQRIAARCVLQNLSRQETEQFIYQHVEQAGRTREEIFNDEAVEEIHRNTDGVPRLINQLCDQSLLLAASRDQQPVDRTLIREAWAEMQNMPIAAVDAGPVDTESGPIVEFGQLGDYDASSDFEDSQSDVGEEDPFAAQASDEVCEDACCGEACDEVADDDQPADETVAEHSEDAYDTNATDFTPSGIHASAAALAATAFAANAYNSDPFTPEEDEQEPEDGNTEAERIASLEQEQEELLEQTRGLDESASEEVESSFDEYEEQQNDDPSDAEDMTAADPFQPSEDAENNADSQEATEETFAASEEGFEQEENLSPMAQCSVEEQLGLVEPEAVEPSTFHTPAFEPRPFVESEVYQAQEAEASQDENAAEDAGQAEGFSDPFAESFEDEELLQDAYSPFVAEQNQASLGVTSSQLSHLTPLDEVEAVDAEAVSDDWNSQTAESAIDELDEVGISNETGLTDGFNEDDLQPADGSQASDGFDATDSTEDWQNNPETAWDPSQFQVPSQVEAKTPDSFVPVPSCRTEIPSVIGSPEDISPGISASNEDPFVPQAEQPVDADLEALTSDLGAASTFDFDTPQDSGEATTESSLMDLNDLVPGHMLHQMEASNAGQDDVTTGDAGFAAPYSAHATVEDSVSPEAAAQAEARRKTEEFMRTFQAQRDVEAPSESEDVAPAEQVAASGESAEHPEEQSQEILKEIFSQQQILDEVHYTDSFNADADQTNTSAGNAEAEPSLDGQGADSVSVETPVTEYEGYQQEGETPAAQDDRDMLLVNETQQYTPPEAAETPQSPLFPNVEPSTGNARRLDYEQLFEQLRNSTPET